MWPLEVDHGDADNICIEDLIPLSNISTESTLIVIEQIFGPRKLEMDR